MDEGIINGKIAKEVFREMFLTGEMPEQVIEKKDLRQITDRTFLEAVILRKIKDNQELVEEIRSGKEKALAFLVGQVMKETRGRANPELVNSILEEKMNENRYDY